MGLKVYIDGCTLGNHQRYVDERKSYIAIIMEDNGKPIIEKLYSCPCETNNETEFYAMIAGIILAEQATFDIKNVQFISDSKLLINSIRKKNSLKNKNLIKQLEQINALMMSNEISSNQMFWHPRENNKAGHMIDDMRMQNVITKKRDSFILGDMKTWNLK